VKQQTGHTELGLKNKEAGALTYSTTKAMKRICDGIYCQIRISQRRTAAQLDLLSVQVWLVAWILNLSHYSQIRMQVNKLLKDVLNTVSSNTSTCSSGFATLFRLNRNINYLFYFTLRV